MTQTRDEALTDMLEAGDDVIRASNTLMLLLAGDMPMTKRTIEDAIRRALNARNEWDNARALIAQEPDQ